MLFEHGREIIHIFKAAHFRNLGNRKAICDKQLLCVVDFHFCYKSDRRYTKGFVKKGAEVRVFQSDRITKRLVVKMLCAVMLQDIVMCFLHI